MADMNTTVLEVDAGKSVTTLKEFKKHIDDLRGTVLSLKEGTADYDKAVQELRSEQQRLNDVMKIGKDYADAEEGSYNHLVNTMAELKKQWRATTDEAERANLGQKILDINNKLKELDASTGNFQRNVGDYSNAFEEAFKKSLQGLSSVNGSVGTLAKDIANLFPVIKKVVQASTTGLKGIKAALASTGIGLLVVALGEIVTHWEEIYKWSVKTLGINKKNYEAIEAQKKAMEDYKQSVKDANSEIEQQGRLMSAMGAEEVDQLKERKKALEEQQRITKQNLEAAQYRVDNKVGSRGMRKEDEEAIKQYTEDLKTYAEEIKKTEDAIIVAQTKALKKAQDIDEAAALSIKSRAEQLRIAYEKDKAELEKHGIDTTNLTKKYHKELADLNKQLAEKMKADVAAVDWAGYVSEAYKNLLNETQAYYQKTATETAEFNYKVRLDKAEKAKKDEEKYIKDNYDKEKLLLDKSLKEGKVSQEQYNTQLAELQQRLDDKKLEIDKRYEDLRGQLALKKEAEITDGITKEAEKRASKLIAQSKAGLGQQTEKINLQYDLEDSQNPGALNNAFDVDAIEGYYKRLIDTENALYSARKQSYTELITSLEGELQKMDENSEAYKTTAQEISDLKIELSNIETEHIIANNDIQNESEEKLADARKQRIATYIQGLNSMSSVLSTFSGIIQDEAKEEYESGEISKEVAKERFENAKAFAYASTVLNMASGIMTAMSGAFTTKSGPWDIALAAIQAAAIAATGIAQLATIKRQKFSSSGGGGSTTSSYADATPSLNEYTPEYTATATNQTEMSELANAMSKQQLYVSVTDIDSVQNTVKTREEEATF